MMLRQLIARVAAPLIVLGFVLAVAKGVAFAATLPTDVATRRNDNSYIEKIVSTYPVMKDTFTIASVEIVKQHWVVVEIKNKQNSDTLHTLIYDPTRSADDMQVVSAPSTRSTYDDLTSPANIPSTQGGVHV